MAQLTKMQQKIYDYIAQAIQDQGYPPSVREIGEAVGLKSPSTVHFHLKHLEELGVIGKQAGKGRALTLTEASRESQAPESQPPENQVPIVGNVAAGSPILAQDCIEDILPCGSGASPCWARASCRMTWWWCTSSLPPTTERSWWPCWGTRPR